MGKEASPCPPHPLPLNSFFGEEKLPFPSRQTAEHRYPWRKKKRKRGECHVFFLSAETSKTAASISSSSTLPDLSERNAICFIFPRHITKSPSSPLFRFSIYDGGRPLLTFFSFSFYPSSILIIIFSLPHFSDTRSPHTRYDRDDRRCFPFLFSIEIHLDIIAVSFSRPFPPFPSIPLSSLLLFRELQ